MSAVDILCSQFLIMVNYIFKHNHGSVTFKFVGLDCGTDLVIGTSHDAIDQGAVAYLFT